MSDILDLLAGAPFWIATLRIATPLILGTLGVLLCERAGVLNLGIEGIMVAGAFCGWLAVYLGLPLWGGVAVAALTAVLTLVAVMTLPIGWILAGSVVPIILWAWLLREIHRLLRFRGDDPDFDAERDDPQGAGRQRGRRSGRELGAVDLLGRRGRRAALVTAGRAGASNTIKSRPAWARCCRWPWPCSG